MNSDSKTGLLSLQTSGNMSLLKVFILKMVLTSSNINSNHT
eukprot:CAMPEP_0185923290 /NCGR_PEP_ID=MMETSP0924C-20121207/11003_1 /TAXON_ID=321610 /ORGANISM="Perkinsus chesapeaki, Strain ATCC PRA-65" /LENGTH=40 /DNA_ID= /DNA_START= /DNA_END= /DNA_ORIENTATION=